MHKKNYNIRRPSYSVRLNIYNMTLVSTPGKFFTRTPQERSELTPGRELRMSPEECPKNSLSTAIASGGFSSPPKPSKLCGNICKALRGNNGPNLTTGRRFIEKVGYARMADSSTHRQSLFFFVHAYVIRTTLCNHIEKSGTNKSIGFQDKKKGNLQHVQTATF